MAKMDYPLCVNQLLYGLYNRFEYAVTSSVIDHIHYHLAIEYVVASSVIDHVHYHLAIILNFHPLKPIPSCHIKTQEDCPKFGLHV